MDDKQKLHILAYELIPIMNDLESVPKQIVFDHIASCEACRQLYANVMEFDDRFPELPKSADDEIKPLKSLVQFNKGLKILMFAIRIFVILLPMLVAGLWDSDFIHAAFLVFYPPVALFLLVFTWIFFNRKWLIISLCIDIGLVFIFGDIFTLLF